ncbi:transglycosylase domain-containing protein [Clostridium oryzae]|uniref:Penicillin-binding protein 1A n=1 Tax=Clostridium oryzae TaxID=1450648 RepID=A0A1V4IUF3_9CLOT|nr:PBP1A family penicillin-binding protein [Clostridium oryzae]OPJ63566.1 penicillin-binding protein 1A/1B [Clostridium oryzae]
MGKKKKKKKKNIVLRIIKYFFATFVLLGLFAAVALAGVVLAMVKTAPQLDVNSILELNQPSTLYDDKGKLMDKAPTDIKREVVSLKHIPKNLQDAVVSIEDERFWKHPGIDVRRILGSAFIDAKRLLSNTPGLHGASTLDQQLIKNTVLGNEVTPKRKIQEMYLALKLDKALSKDQILEAYLNTINLGGNINGVQAASKRYFGKSVSKLSLVQCAYLAGVTQNPYKYGYISTYARKNPSYYMTRTETVLLMMNKNGYIDQQTYQKALSDLKKGKLHFVKVKSTSTTNKLDYEWFSRPVMDAVKSDLMRQYNYSTEEVNKLIMYGGLKIYTTMDRNLEKKAQAIINSNTVLGSAGSSKKIPEPQASAVIMDYKTGKVKVIIGGRGKQPAASYNRAASTKFLRATGSSIKPLTVYSPAINTQQLTAGSVVDDSPIPKEIGMQWKQADGSPYNPKNDNLLYRGYVTVREALRRSINVVAVKMEYQIGLSTGAAYAEKYGIHFSDSEKTNMASLALGEFTGSNPLQMSAAYGTFGNSGIYTSPILYTKVVDKTGKVLLENSPKSHKVLSSQAAYIMYDMLKGPTSSAPGATAPSARFGAMPVAGKTGTASSKTNLWFCGLTPYYSGAIWIGNDNYRPLVGLKSNDAARLWAQIMYEANKNKTVKDIAEPSGIVTRKICIDSGKVPKAECYHDPRGSRVRTEMFIAGTEPSEICDVHVSAKINRANGLLATANTPQSLITTKIFIKRDGSSSNLLDSKYVLPKKHDGTKAVNNVPNTKSNTAKDTDKTTDKTNPNNDSPIVPNKNGDNGTNTKPNNNKNTDNNSGNDGNDNTDTGGNNDNTDNDNEDNGENIPTP